MRMVSVLIEFAFTFRIPVLNVDSTMSIIKTTYLVSKCRLDLLCFVFDTISPYCIYYSKNSDNNLGTIHFYLV